MKKKHLIAAASLVGTLLLVGAGCATSTNTNEDTTTNTNKTTNSSTTNTNTAAKTTTEAGNAAISIVSPVDGATVSSTFDVKVKISDFTLAPDEVEKANVEGKGHYHVWVDGKYIAPGVSEMTTLKDIKAGEHEIMVSLQNNDHTDLSTVVKSEAVTVTVK